MEDFLFAHFEVNDEPGGEHVSKKNSLELDFELQFIVYKPDLFRKELLFNKTIIILHKLFERLDADTGAINVLIIMKGSFLSFSYIIPVVCHF